MRALILMLCGLPLMAAIDGRVMNKTSGQPQAGVKVTLVKIGQGGMEDAGSATTAADGRFQLAGDNTGLHLLRAMWQGVSYDAQIAPGAATTGLEIPIYDALARVSAVDPTQDMILVESDGKQLAVSEAVIFQNDSQTTWFDPKAGTLRFTAPAEASGLTVRVTPQGGLPIERAPTQTGEKGVWMMAAPVKPGETRFDVIYKLAVKEPLVISGRILHEPGPVRLVVPTGMTAEGDTLVALGNEPRSGAMIYDIKGGVYKVKLGGAGSMQAQQAAASAPASGGADQAADADDQGGPRIQEIQPPGYERYFAWALGLIVAFLGLSFAAQYLKGGATPPAGGKPKA